MQRTLEAELRLARPVPPMPTSAAVSFARFLATTALDERREPPSTRQLPAWMQRLPIRRGVVMAAVALVGLAGVAVAGSNRDWWFAHTPELEPIDQPVVITTSDSPSWLQRQNRDVWRSGGNMIGRSAGIRWEFVAFRTKRPKPDGSVCYGITPNPPNPTGEGAGAACSKPAFPGPGHSDDPNYDTHWLTYAFLIPEEMSKATVQYFYGPTASNVARVDLILGYSRSITVHTIPAPDGLGLPLRFYVAVLSPNEVVRALVPRDENGDALERWDISSEH